MHPLEDGEICTPKDQNLRELTLSKIVSSFVFKKPNAFKKYENDGRRKHANAENCRKNQNIKVKNRILKSFFQFFPASIN